MATATLKATATISGETANITLAGAELRWSVAGSRELRLDLEAEVLGVECNGNVAVIKALVAEDGRPASCIASGDAAKRERRDFRFELVPPEDSSWVDAVRAAIDSFGRPKRLLVLVNPFGGKKCGPRIYGDEVKPLLEAAGIHVTMRETARQLHAQEIASSVDLAMFDGIICVSGDGILVEILNGLLQRNDWDKAIKMPLGVIPAGTGNGMAKSLLHSAGEIFSVPNAVFAIIRGHKRALDVASIIQGEKKYFSVLILAWGLVADIDIESEKYRWMGSARLDFYSLLRIVNLRKYSGSVKFVPAPGYEGYGEPVNESEPIFVGHHDHSNTGHHSITYRGPLVHFPNSEWRSVDGPFVVVWVNNVPWSAENIMSAPQAKFADGYLDVIIVRDCPKAALLSMLLKMSDGNHVKSPYVKYMKVKAIQLSPGNRVDDPKRGGIIDCDGEVLARADTDDNGQDKLMAYGPPIQMAVDQGLATIYTPR